LWWISSSDGVGFGWCGSEKLLLVSVEGLSVSHSKTVFEIKTVRKIPFQRPRPPDGFIST
jgi:hypothetical protein